MSKATDARTALATKRDRLVGRLRKMDLDARHGGAPNKIIIEHHRPEKLSSDGKTLILDGKQIIIDERWLAERIRSAGGMGVILSTNHGTPVSIVHTFSIEDAREPGDPIAYCRMVYTSGNDYGSSRRIEIRGNDDDQLLATTDFQNIADEIVAMLNATDR